MDMHRHFDTLAGPEVTPTMDDINADLDRGRRALRKRRVMQTLAGSAFAAAALVAGIVIATTNVPAPAAPTAAQSQGQRPAGVGTRLVAYTGSQPKGYTIDKVPDGFEIQADNTSELILAPKDALDKNPQSFVGKIGIMLQSTDSHYVPQGKKVKVGDLEGVLVPQAPASSTAATPPARDATPPARDVTDPTTLWTQTLWVKQPNGVYLLVQFWEGLALSESDMLDIGAGIHVHKDAVQGGG
ncbi:hypothetical protein [Dactylosporangium sp. NPDC005555]|uniref:hypothetical protein n=1 Tax=Dactylosporangium sp. NPDC005555 TaxID=3154889 RepID=UPI0033A4AA81